MDCPVIKGAAYVLVHAPDMVAQQGMVQIAERMMKSDSEYIKELYNHLRTYEEVVQYAPNQVYIGNMMPDDLRQYTIPWYEKKIKEAKRFGKYGEIMPQDEFIALIKISDVFDLIALDKNFIKTIKEKLYKHPYFKEDIIKLGEGEEFEEIQKSIEQQNAKALLNNGKIVGCVQRAHDSDMNLTADVMLQNFAAKASGILAFKHLLDKTDIKAHEIEYVIECSGETCGDMNQRGGGNFAKSIAEGSGAVNASGSDTKGFCAAPMHALVEAAALVQSGIYKNVVVVAGGSTAKLGLNGKEHINHNIPILEDLLGSFAILISQNDGIHPVIRTDLIGKHSVGTGSSPLAVISSLISTPLAKGGYQTTDIDKYAVEMQNPDITIPAGIGDIPEANYKMIAALAVQREEINSKDISKFILDHGLPGWTPTQGHIPSGVSYIGFALEELMNRDFNAVMIIGKGSLFLGRMTNLFDGVSVILERNPGTEEKAGVGFTQEEIKYMIAEIMEDFASRLLKGRSDKNV